MLRAIPALALCLAMSMLPAPSWSQATPPEAPCVTSDLSVAEPRLYGLGDTVHVVARGGCAARIEKERQKVAAGKVALLHLDGVAMKGLVLSLSPVPPTAAVPATAVAPPAFDLAFRIARNSQDNDGRVAWDAMLEKQNMGYTMRLPMALSIGSELPVAIGGEPLQFTTVRGGETMVWTVVVVGVALLVGGFALLLRGNALRDGWGAAYSLGKSQMAFWGLLVFLSFVGILLLTGSMERIPPQTLALLGISGATGLAAVLIGSAKDSAVDAVAKLSVERAALTAKPAHAVTAADATRAVEIDKTVLALNAYMARPHTGFADFCRDICDDGTGLSFHRVQVVMWTLLLSAVFIWTVTEVISMPEFPNELLLLMGISNGTYLGFKFPEKV